MQCLNLALFIDAEYLGAIMGIEIKEDYVPHLIFKLRVIGDFEFLRAVRANVLALPYSLHQHAGNAQLRHHVPLRSGLRSRLRCLDYRLGAVWKSRPSLASNAITD
jgi:hypothetical protein